MIKKIHADIRQAMLEQGLRIAALKGLRGLTVRELAASSDVNLGSFVYHFGKREHFITKLVELWYAPMYEELKQAADKVESKSAVERFSSVMGQLIVLVSQHTGFIAHLLSDAMSGEVAAQQFLLSLPGRHPKLLLMLLEQAQHEGAIIQENSLDLLLFVAASVGLPFVLAGNALTEQDWLPASAQFWKQKMADPKTAQQRLEWALRGISMEQGKV